MAVSTLAECQCHKPDADPYECEADDCAGYFPELSPSAGGWSPRERSAKVSKVCSTCGWRTTVWHVDDGSAEAELHGHTARLHGGRYR